MAENASAMDNLDPHGIGNYLSPAGLASFFGALFGVLPIILGIIGGTLAIAWYSVQLWECDTVQNYIKTHTARKVAKRVADLEVRQSAIVGELKELGVLVHAATDVQHHDGGTHDNTQTRIETTTVQIKK
jgi:hypothetical protein